MNFQRLLLLPVLICLGWTPAFAQKTVVLIRHAEESAHSGVNLSSKGFQRAVQLPRLFKKILGETPVAAIYAQGARHSGSSMRSIQTIVPTAEHYHLHLVDRFEKWDAKEAIKHIRKNATEYQNKAVIVSWGSDELGDLVKHFGYKPGGKKLVWDKAVYDRVWILDFDSKGKLIRFSDKAQMLMKGDQDASHDASIALPDCNSVLKNR